MTDKELLELAAKAAGMQAIGDSELGLHISSEGCKAGYLWNPLTDDGDALRLAVKLEIDMGFGFPKDSVTCIYPDEPTHAPIIQEEFINDPMAATRRAIVRAAAEIGKEMK